MELAMDSGSGGGLSEVVVDRWWLLFIKMDILFYYVIYIILLC